MAAQRPCRHHPFDYSYIEDIAVSETNHNVVYVTHHPGPAQSGVVYKSTNGGVSWSPTALLEPTNTKHIIKLMVHPSDENIVYAMTGKSRWGCGEANLYRSVNGGASWMEIGAAQGDVLDFDLHPSDTETVFLSTFQSNYTTLPNCFDLGFSDDGATAYLGGDENSGELYKSTNGGMSFTQICDKSGIISVGIDNPDNIKILDVLYPYDWNDNAGTWETVNGGQSWNQIGLVQNWEKGYSENQYFAFASSFNGYNKTVTKNIFNSDQFFGSYGQWAWASFDGGVTLNNVSTKEISPNHWRSTGVENIEGHVLEVNRSNPDVVYMGAWDIGFFYSTDHGDSWTRTQPNYNQYPEYSWNLGTPGQIEANMARRGAGSNVTTIVNDPVRENVVWASFSKEQFTDESEDTYAKTGLFRSTNYGEDWTLITAGLPAFDQSFRMYGLSIDPSSNQNSRTMYVTVDGTVYKSTNDGLAWSVALSGHKLKFTAVSDDGSVVYAGGQDGFWRSQNGGAWTEVGTPAMRKQSANVRPDIVPTWVSYPDNAEPIYPFEGVFDIKIDPNNNSKVYVVVHGPNGGVYRSINKGNSWSNNLLPDTDLRGIAIAPANSDVVYATSSMNYHSGGYGNSLGILYSVNGGDSWQPVNDGMAYNYGGMIEVEYGDNPYVWAWSPGTGVQYARVPFFSNEVNLNIKVMLQGPYNTATNLMDDVLRTSNNIPVYSPYTALGFEVGGGATLNAGLLNASGNNAIVDWVIVELRDGSSPTEVVVVKEALIQRDGDIVNPDGSALTMKVPSNINNVYVAIRHRNHLGFRTQNSYNTNAAITIDFTQTNIPLYGANAMNFVDGKNVMISGNANSDGQVNSIDSNNYWRVQNSGSFYYLNSGADLNMDGSVNAVDRNSHWRINNSKTEQLD